MKLKGMIVPAAVVFQTLNPSCSGNRASIVEHPNAAQNRHSSASAHLIYMLRLPHSDLRAVRAGLIA